MSVRGHGAWEDLMAPHRMVWNCVLASFLLVSLACADTDEAISLLGEAASTTRSAQTGLRSGDPLCADPRSVLASDKGSVVEVCGRIIDEGTQDCPDCPNGAVQYITFEGGFNVISYYWNFSSYEGACLRALDTVELMGSKPVFLYGAREGYAGSKCAANSDGSLDCEGGDYFMPFEGCD